MGKVAISRIAQDATGRLRVYPWAEEVDYAFIWRDASSVRWDESDRSLYVLPVEGFTLVDEMRQILRAVEGEYGDTLIVDPATIYAVSTEMKSKLRDVVAGQ